MKRLTLPAIVSLLLILPLVDAWGASAISALASPAPYAAASGSGGIPASEVPVSRPNVAQNVPPCSRWPYYNECLRRCPGHPNGYAACAQRCRANIEADVGRCRP